MALLSGEAGIGKSRLVRSLRERLEAEAHTPLRYQGSPYHTDSALHPIVEQLERAAGFERDDTAEAKLAKLEGLLADGTEDVSVVAPLVADLLSVPTGSRYPPLDLTPRQRKAKLFQMLLAQLEGLATKQPILEIFEDAHWLDPTTAELLGLAVDRIRSSAGAPSRHLPSRVHAGLGAPTPRHHAHAQRPRPAAGHGHGRARHRRQGAARGGAGADRGAGRTACRCSSRS